MIDGFVPDRYTDRAVPVFRKELEPGKVISYSAQSADEPPVLVLSWVVQNGEKLSAWRRRMTHVCERCGSPRARTHLLEFETPEKVTRAHTTQREDLWHLCAEEETTGE